MNETNSYEMFHMMKRLAAGVAVLAVFCVAVMTTGFVSTAFVVVSLMGAVLGGAIGVGIRWAWARRSNRE